MSYLRYLCQFVHSGVQRISCCVFVLYIVVLCLVCPLLLASLDFPFLISLSVFSNVFSLILINLLVPKDF
jgi:hypothetical protein